MSLDFTIHLLLSTPNTNPAKEKEVLKKETTKKKKNGESDRIGNVPNEKHKKVKKTKKAKVAESETPIKKTDRTGVVSVVAAKPLNGSKIASSLDFANPEEEQIGLGGESNW